MPMLAKRIRTSALITIVGVSFAILGGWYFVFFISLLLGVASWEYWNMYRKGGYEPNAAVLISAIIVLVIFRFQKGFVGSDLILTIAILATMAIFTIRYELGQKNSSIDFGITLSGILYIGWLGAYLISLRILPSGGWWVMLTILLVSMADIGAYSIGSKFGKNKMAPRLSPNKTWEGYFGGILFAIIFGAILGAIWHNFAPAITLRIGLIQGAVLGFITPLGDLGESMLKRQFGVKDSSNLLPGVGGVMDRIDSWLWAACISYYLIVFIFL